MAFQRQIAFERENDLSSSMLVRCLQEQGCWPQVLKQRGGKKKEHMKQNFTIKKSCLEELMESFFEVFSSAWQRLQGTAKPGLRNS